MQRADLDCRRSVGGRGSSVRGALWSGRTIRVVGDVGGNGVLCPMWKHRRRQLPVADLERSALGADRSWIVELLRREVDSLPGMGERQQPGDKEEAPWLARRIEAYAYDRSLLSKHGRHRRFQRYP